MGSFSVRRTVEGLLPKDQAEYFAQWAFGYDFKELEGLLAFAQAWNNLHSDLFEINYEDHPKDGIIKMVNYWKKITDI